MKRPYLVESVRMRTRFALALVAAALSLPLVAAASTAAGSQAVLPVSTRLQTAIVDGAAFNSETSARAFERARQTGATAVRLGLAWEAVAPATPSDTFSAEDPNDPGYNWAWFDRQVQQAAARNLEPIVNIHGAPTWAVPLDVRGGPYKPDPVKLAAFATAAALRYNGSQEGLPSVRYWQLWNEPNLALFLRPQLVGKTVYSAYWYRQMLNAFASAVHSVNPQNVVIGGGTSPFTSRAGKRTSWGPGPLLFLREVLCLSKDLRPKCDERVSFDAWAHHPYTSGGPSHKASNPDDVSLGNLPRMRDALDAGVRTGHIRSRHKLRFWVTEFSWDTNPPDPNAMPIALQTRWVSEALYTMARSGVSLVTWFSIRDEPRSAPYQAGMYFLDGRPKPSLRAFRFPFVSFRRGNSIEVWGRTPSEKPGQVVIEHRSAGTWKRVDSLRTNEVGMFSGRVPPVTSGWMRARLATGSEASHPFSLTEPPDRFYRPFGEPG
jgi:hypothetical protein